jgi:hypothetical protein
MTLSVGEQFAHALRDKDTERLKALLDPGVDFRAMTPSRFWESSDVDDIVDETILGTWFAAERTITGLVAIETDRVGPLERVGYRFAVEQPDGECTIEQQAYYVTDGAAITWLRIMCTGFVPAA